MTWVRDENGNYKKTVRCSYCFQTGHSRRSCPSIYPNGTPAQQRAKAREGAKEHRKLVRAQRKLDKAAGKVVPKVARNCGYCGEEGHMRRHCPTLIQDKAVLVDATVKYREALVEEATEKGVGVGALLVQRGRVWSGAKAEYVNQNLYYVVTGADFSKASPFYNWAISKRDRQNYEQNRWITVLGVNGDSYAMGYKTTAGLPYKIADNMTEETDGVFTSEMLDRWGQGKGLSNVEVIVKKDVSLPDDFASHEIATEIVEDYFSNKTKKREHYNVLDRIEYLKQNDRL